MSTLVKVGEEDIVLKDSKGQKKETFVSEEGTYHTLFRVRQQY